MSVIATALKHLLAAGVTGDALVAAVAELEASMPNGSDEAAERRRRRDRDRKRAVRGIPQTSADSAESADTASRAHVVNTTSSSLRSEEAYPPPTAKAVGAPKGASRPSRRCPNTWTPAELTIAKLRAEGFTPGDLERALTRMRDHEFKTGRSDWDATYRNWVREDADRKPKAPDGQRPDPKLAARQANLARSWAGSEIAVGDGRRPFGDP